MTLPRRNLLFSIVALACLRANVARASESRVFGRYRFAGGKKQTERFDAAVEDVVSELNVVLRPIARNKLRESQKASVHVEIASEHGVIVVRRDGAPDIRGRPDNERFAWKNRYGSELRVRMKLNASRLELHFEGSRSHTVTTYTVSDDGTRLVMRTAITDSRLPKPLRFAFTYKRAKSGV